MNLNDSPFLNAGVISLATLDSAMCVQQSTGPMAGCIPGLGEDVCSYGPFLGMKAELELLRQGDVKPLIIPDVVYKHGDKEDWITIHVTWDRRTSNYAVLTTIQDEEYDLRRTQLQKIRSQRVQQEQLAAATTQIRNLTSLYQSIIDSSGDFIFRLNSQANIIFTNLRANTFLGKTLGQLQGHPIAQVILEEQHNDFWTDAISAARSNQSHLGEMIISDANGNRRSISWTTQWLGADGPQEYQVLGRDITDAKLLDEARKKANRDVVVTAITQERLRIARDLHDTLVRSILTVLTQIRLVKRLVEPNPSSALTELLAAESVAMEGVGLARESISSMRIELSEERPLGKSLVNLVNAAKNRKDLAINLDLDSSSIDLYCPAAEATYRIVSEALRNIELHAKASKVKITICSGPWMGAPSLQSEISDDGVGFDATVAPADHYGVTGMYEQARQAGGALTLSSSKGNGTTIQCNIPL